MDKKYHVLVFPGGTEIGLEIHKSLRYCKEINLFSAGLNISSHAPYVFAHYHVLPIIQDPSWLESLNKLISQLQIDFVIPAYDDIIVALMSNQDKINARVVSSPLETCLISRSKSKTYQLLADVVPVPSLYPHDCIGDIPHYPVFIKPDKGQGSQHTHLVHSEEDLRQVLAADNHEYIVLEYLPGEEYTIDCFSDRDAGLLFCSGRERIRTKSGISMHCRPVTNELFREYAEAIAKKLTFYGAWFFQVKRDCNGILKLLEVAPRIAGTSALHRVQGVNLPLLSIYEQERIPLEIMTNDLYVELDRALVNRYILNWQYDTVYVDLDDTLILNGCINVALISYLYQCFNRHIHIVLVTKHRHHVGRTLRKYRISQKLFDEIIHLDSGDNKWEQLHEEKAIFIDDSFSERKAVAQQVGIPTFDCSMLEVLLDERT